MKLDWDPKHTPNIKLGLHITQIVISFVVWALEIAVFKGGKVVGKNGWTFGVCFLSIPAWIYLIMTPRFARARRFANPQAMLAVDGVFAVLWLSAFATQASYNSSGQCEKACRLSRVIVGLGVFNTFFWVGTAIISAYTLTFYNFHGSLPGYDARKIRDGGDNSIDPDKAAFSMAPHDEEAYERVNADDHEGPMSYGGASARYGNANPYSAEEHDMDDPGRYGSLPPRNEPLFDSRTEYSSGPPVIPPVVPDQYGSQPAADPAQFPAGNYR